MVRKPAQGLKGGSVKQADPRERCECSGVRTQMPYYDDGWRLAALEKGKNSVNFWPVYALWPNQNCTEIEQADRTGSKQRWDLEPWRTLGEMWRERLAHSPERVSHSPKGTNRVGLRGGGHRRWTPVHQLERNREDGSRRDRILTHNTDLPWVRRRRLSFIQVKSNKVRMGYFLSSGNQ